MAAFCLVLAVTAALFPPVDVQAATSTQVVYVGETYEANLGFDRVQSVKSSNPKVATASKTKDYDYTVIPKKPGKTVVTIKYLTADKKKMKTMKVTFTVKKLDLKITAQNLDGGYVLFKVKNNTAQVFDKITFSYTLKDKNGKKLVSSSDGFMTRILAKSTAYDSVYIGKEYKVDCSKAVFQVTSAERSFTCKYTNAESGDFTETFTTEEVTDDTLSLQIKWENKRDNYLLGVDYIFLYDADDNIIGLERWTFGMVLKSVKNSWPITVSVSKADHPTYDHYKIVTKAYTYVSVY
jgi:hypothetical protein